MAIQGRTYVPPILIRSDPADFATEKNPVTVVIRADPTDRKWLATPPVTLSRSQTADFATIGIPGPLVYTPTNKAQLIPPPIIVRAPDIPVAPVGSSVIEPLIVVPPNPKPVFTTVLTRSSLEDFSTPVGRQPLIVVPQGRQRATPPILGRTSLEDNKGAQPLVVTPPQRAGLPAPAILTRANPATFTTEKIYPAIVYTPLVPRAWFRGVTILPLPAPTIAPPPPGPPADVDWCAGTPVIDWAAGPIVTGWVASDPVTGWMALTPEEDC